MCVCVVDTQRLFFLPVKLDLYLLHPSLLGASCCPFIRPCIFPHQSLKNCSLAKSFCANFHISVTCQFNSRTHMKQKCINQIHREKMRANFSGLLIKIKKYIYKKRRPLMSSLSLALLIWQVFSLNNFLLQFYYSYSLFKRLNSGFNLHLQTSVSFSTWQALPHMQAHPCTPCHDSSNRIHFKKKGLRRRAYFTLSSSNNNIKNFKNTRHKAQTQQNLFSASQD